MNIQKIELSKLNPAPYNPCKRLRLGDVEYEKLRRFIAELPYQRPYL